MDDYQDLTQKAARMEARIKRLTLLQELARAELEEILRSAQTDLDALKLQIQVERYEGKHEENNNNETQ